MKLRFQAIMTSTSGAFTYGLCKIVYLRDCLEAASAIRCHLAMRLDPCSVSPLLALPTPFHPAQADSISANTNKRIAILQFVSSLLHNATCMPD